MGDLTTLSAAYAWLGATPGSDDANLQKAISATSAQIEAVCGRVFTATNYLETYDGPGNGVLTLRQYPIISVTQVALDGFALPASTGQTYGWLARPPRSIALIGSVFGRGLQNVGVTYRAGYATIPADLELACLEWLKVGYLARTTSPDRGPLTEEAAGGSSRKYATPVPGSTTVSGVPAPAKIIPTLNAYRNVVPA